MWPTTWLDTLAAHHHQPHAGGGRHRRAVGAPDSRRLQRVAWIRRTINAQTFELRDAANALVPASIVYSAQFKVRAHHCPRARSQQFRHLHRRPCAAARPIRASRMPPATRCAATVTLVVHHRGCRRPVPCIDLERFRRRRPSPPTRTTSSVELGVKFRSDVNGYIKGDPLLQGSRQYRRTRGHICGPPPGQLLAQATFGSENPRVAGSRHCFATPMRGDRQHHLRRLVPRAERWLLTHRQPRSRLRVSTTACCTFPERLRGMRQRRVCLRHRQPFPASSFKLLTTGSTWCSTSRARPAPDTTAAGDFDRRAGCHRHLRDGQQPLALGGTADDNVLVTQVTWSNDRGGSGTALGTSSWSVPAHRAAIRCQRHHVHGARCRRTMLAPMCSR